MYKILQDFEKQTAHSSPDGIPNQVLINEEKNEFIINWILMFHPIKN